MLLCKLFPKPLKVSALVKSAAHFSQAESKCFTHSPIDAVVILQGVTCVSPATIHSHALALMLQHEGSLVCQIK